MSSWFTSYYFRRFLLPTLLLVVTALILGCYFETNDDVFIVFLLRGVGMTQPVTDLHLYYHGLAAVLAALYQVIPALPWYGLLQYSLLLTAFILLFSIIDRVIGRLPAWARVALLIVFFVAACLEHVMLMNFTRVPVLLAGATALYSLQRLQRHVRGWDWWWLGGGLLMLLAWAIRPSGAFLGLAVAAPAFFLAPRRPGLVLLGAYGALLLAGSGFIMARRTAAEIHYQQIDILKANRKDYNMYLMQPRTAQDSVALESLDTWWGLGDTTMVNKAFFKRTATAFPSRSVQDDMLPKTQALAARLARDSFFILFLNLALLWALWRQPPTVGRRWTWLYTVYIGLLVLVMSIVLKLPPHVAGPLLSVATAVNFALILPQLVVWPFSSRQLEVVSLVLLSILLGGYLVKNGVRSKQRRQEQHQCEMYMNQVAAYVGKRPMVEVSMFVRSLSPFRNYDLGGGPVLLLNGWMANDPSQVKLMQQLTGTGSFQLAMQRLAARPNVVWLFPTAFGDFFTRYLAALPATTIRTAPTFCPVGPKLPEVNEFLPMPAFHTVCVPGTLSAPQQANH